MEFNHTLASDAIMDKLNYYIDSLTYALEDDSYIDIVKYYTYLIGFNDMLFIVGDSLNEHGYLIVTSMLEQTLKRCNKEYRHALKKCKR